MTRSSWYYVTFCRSLSSLFEALFITHNYGKYKGAVYWIWKFEVRYIQCLWIHLLFTKQCISAITMFSMEGNFEVVCYQQTWHRENQRLQINDKFFKYYSYRPVLIRAIAFCNISTTVRKKMSHCSAYNSMTAWHVFRTLNYERPSVLYCMYTYIYIYPYICVSFIADS
jgi:hypothetical protein